MLSRLAIHVVIAVGTTSAAFGSPALAASSQDGPVANGARSAAAIAAASPECRGATISGSGDRQEHTILCLINAARAQAGVPRLRRSRALARAAERHARDMTRRDYFDHASPEGTTPDGRAARAGYDSSLIAENLAFGTGSWGTPAGAVAQWLGSAPHRRALLDRRARDLGIGAADGSPLRGAHGGTTVAAMFGRR